MILPRYVQDDITLAGVMGDALADHAAENLAGKTVGDVLPKQPRKVPSRRRARRRDQGGRRDGGSMRSPLIAVTKTGQTARRDHRVTPARRRAQILSAPSPPNAATLSAASNVT